MGMQFHFKVYKNFSLKGIISGSSSVYAVADRDNFFNIPSDKEEKQKYYLPAIINNNVFRLEGEHGPNFGTKILSLWRETISFLWEEIYGVPVIGFETFVLEETYRAGSMYKADNWTHVGKTKGSAKEQGGFGTKHSRKKVPKKLIFCRWRNMKEQTPSVKYESCWQEETEEQKRRAQELSEKREKVRGMRFYRNDPIKEQYEYQLSIQ